VTTTRYNSYISFFNTANNLNCGDVTMFFYRQPQKCGADMALW